MFTTEILPKALILNKETWRWRTSRVGSIWPFSSNQRDPTWNWKVYLLWAPKSTKKSYLTMGNPSAMATCYWPPANLRIFRSFSKYVILYTNRCEISCWFQQWITLYVYLANWVRYVQKRAFLARIPKISKIEIHFGHLMKFAK